MKICTRNPASNPAEDLPLFQWSASARARRTSIPFSAAWLRRRYPLTPRRAMLVSELAGFDTEGSR
jgi:hypothetical protein